MVKETKTGVLIVGAGPSGLTLANVLALGGVPFRIVDAKADIVEESRALVVHAKTLEILDKIGVAERAIAGGQRMGAARLLNEGRPSGEIAFMDDGAEERTPYPMVLIYEQNRLERLLARNLEGAGSEVEWGTKMLSVSQTAEGVRCNLRGPDGTEESLEARWVVGCDGAHSPVRHELGLGFGGETYEQTLFLADVEMEWAGGDDRATVNLTRAGFLGFFPMPGHKRFRLLGNLPLELEGSEGILPEDIQGILDRHGGVEAKITGSRWTSIYRTHHRISERFRVGRAFLVGDAAHIHSPAGGQGMNTGIGDAFNLGWKLAMVARGEVREVLLNSYEAERVPFARSMLRGSDRGFHLQAASTPATQRLKLLALPSLFWLVSVVPPLRRRAFLLLSQLWTTYRKSPAVAEGAAARRGPHAGDRAPYGFFEAGARAGESIFGGPDHRLLVFEGLQPSNVGLPAAMEEFEGFLERYKAIVDVVPVSAGNGSLHELYGAKSPTLFLVRPDGHIAYRGGASDVVGLKVHLDRLFVRQSTGAPAARDPGGRAAASSTA